MFNENELRLLEKIINNCTINGHEAMTYVGLVNKLSEIINKEEAPIEDNKE